MPIISQYRYYRRDLQNNPDVLYVFGDNEERIGKGGQAKEARDEPNAFGIPTKRKAAHTEDAFWTDKNPKDVAKQARIILEHFWVLQGELMQGRMVVWPEDGIGTGLSDLPTRAPYTMKLIERLVEQTFEKFGVNSND